MSESNELQRIGFDRPKSGTCALTSAKRIYLLYVEKFAGVPYEEARAILTQIAKLVDEVNRNPNDFKQLYDQISSFVYNDMKRDAQCVHALCGADTTSAHHNVPKPSTNLVPESTATAEAVQETPKKRKRGRPRKNPEESAVKKGGKKKSGKEAEKSEPPLIPADPERPVEGVPMHMALHLVDKKVCTMGRDKPRPHQPTPFHPGAHDDLVLRCRYWHRNDQTCGRCAYDQQIISLPVEDVRCRINTVCLGCGMRQQEHLSPEEIPEMRARYTPVRYVGDKLQDEPPAIKKERPAKKEQAELFPALEEATDAQPAPELEVPADPVTETIPESKERPAAEPIPAKPVPVAESSEAIPFPEPAAKGNAPDIAANLFVNWENTDLAYAAALDTAKEVVRGFKGDELIKRWETLTGEKYRPEITRDVMEDAIARNLADVLK